MKKVLVITVVSLAVLWTIFTVVFGRIHYGYNEKMRLEAEETAKKYKEDAEHLRIELQQVKDQLDSCAATQNSPD